MIQRERFEEHQKHLYLGRTMSLIFGSETLDVPRMARIEELLELAIFHTAYDPREIRKQMEIARALAQTEREARLRDAQLLAKVANYSAPEESDADAFRTVLNKTRFEGIKTPWNDKDAS